MKRPKATAPADDAEWRNLRDDKGRLYGRVNRVKMLLEFRTHKETVTFDLKEVLQVVIIEKTVLK